MSFNYVQTQNLTHFVYLIIGTNDDLSCRDYKILDVILAMKDKKAKRKTLSRECDVFYLRTNTKNLTHFI